jgi:predicted nucleic acid-binding protein
MKVAIDSSVLVGLINPLDHRRLQAMELQDALVAAGAELFYFDCVVAEALVLLCGDWKRKIAMLR